MCTFSMEENIRFSTRSGYCQCCACVVLHDKRHLLAKLRICGSENLEQTPSHVRCLVNRPYQHSAKQHMKRGYRISVDMLISVTMTRSSRKVEFNCGDNDCSIQDDSNDNGDYDNNDRGCDCNNGGKLIMNLVIRYASIFLQVFICKTSNHHCWNIDLSLFFFLFGNSNTPNMRHLNLGAIKSIHDFDSVLQEAGKSCP